MTMFLHRAQLGSNVSAKNDSPPTPKIKLDKIAILIIQQRFKTFVTLMTSYLIVVKDYLIY